MNSAKLIRFQKKRSGSTFEQKAKLFLETMRKLFDIYCNDKSQRSKLKEKFKLRMDKNDFAFYEDQKGPRQGKCANAVEKLVESDVNFVKKVTSKEKDVPSTGSINFDSAFDMTMTEIGSDTSKSEESSSASLINVLFSNQQIEQNRSSLREVAFL